MQANVVVEKILMSGTKEIITVIVVLGIQAGNSVKLLIHVEKPPKLTPVHQKQSTPSVLKAVSRRTALPALHLIREA